MRKYSENVRLIARMGILFAVAMVLSLVEGMLPALPMLPVGVKLGLSNIVTMYCLFWLGWRNAVLLSVLKALFVLLTRGPTGGFMSLCGGLVSVMAMVVFKLFLPDYKVVASTVGAVFHNVGQLFASVLILRTWLAFGYLPVMVGSGILMGVVTGITFSVLEPHLERISKG